jgi:hypothetical protein
MNGWLRFLIFLGIIVLGICGLIYFWREIFIVLKGVLGFIAILLIILAVAGLWERIHKAT